MGGEGVRCFILKVAGVGAVVVFLVVVGGAAFFFFLLKAAEAALDVGEVAVAALLEEEDFDEEDLDEEDFEDDFEDDGSSFSFLSYFESPRYLFDSGSLLSPPKGLVGGTRLGSSDEDLRRRRRTEDTDLGGPTQGREGVEARSIALVRRRRRERDPAVITLGGMASGGANT